MIEIIKAIFSARFIVGFFLGGTLVTGYLYAVGNKLNWSIKK